MGNHMFRDRFVVFKTVHVLQVLLDSVLDY